MTPHVVIVGGGFGGLYAARELAGQPVRVTLVDRSNHHLFQPLLYQVATAALSPGDIAQPIRAILRNYEKGLTSWMKQTAANMLVYRDGRYFERTLGPYIDPATGMPAPFPWESWTEEDLDMLPDIKGSL